jgi:hypothetical protein
MGRACAIPVLTRRLRGAQGVARFAHDGHAKHLVCMCSHHWLCLMLSSPSAAACTFKARFVWHWPRRMRLHLTADVLMIVPAYASCCMCRLLKTGDPVQAHDLELVVNATHPKYGAYFFANMRIQRSPQTHCPNELAAWPIACRYELHRLDCSMPCVVCASHCCVVMCSAGAATLQVVSIDNTTNQDCHART